MTSRYRYAIPSRIALFPVYILPVEPRPLAIHFGCPCFFPTKHCLASSNASCSASPPPVARAFSARSSTEPKDFASVEATPNKSTARSQLEADSPTICFRSKWMRNGDTMSVDAGGRAAVLGENAVAAFDAASAAADACKASSLAGFRVA